MSLQKLIQQVYCLVGITNTEECYIISIKATILATEESNKTPVIILN